MYSSLTKRLLFIWVLLIFDTYLILVPNLLLDISYLESLLLDFDFCTHITINYFIHWMYLYI